ncbi:MAG TPA: HipA family kinase [Actinomycetota bacterium]|nr:HipA family kinase [Actinomycetota bacterium]
MLPRRQATRYVAPLREGGSLPGLVEADDLGTYVMKFTGSGQGRKALVAEVIVGELGRRLGLRVPDQVVIDLDAEIGRYEADQEVQDLLTASVGSNLGIDFLPGSFGYDGMRPAIAAAEAGRILWLDAFTANIDRTWRNPNLLLWHRNLWCIDHGAALYFHHSWPRSSPGKFAAQPFDHAGHIFASAAGASRGADEELAAAAQASLDQVLGDVPDEWLEPAPDRTAPDDIRILYRDHLMARLAPPRRWLPEEVAGP